MLPPRDFAALTAQQLATWDNHSAVYTDTILSKQQMQPATDQVLSVVGKHKQIAEGSQFLDLASSAGQPAVPLAKQFPTAMVISTDLSPSSVKLAAERAKAEGLDNLQAQVADAQDLSAFADNSFAVVTCTYGILFMPDYQKVLREVHRVLQPAGLFVATIWSPDPAQVQTIQMFLGFAKALMGDHFNLPPPPGLSDGTQLGQLLEDANFVDVTRRDFPHNLNFGTMQDAVKFMAGPQSQFAPFLNKLWASGRSDIYKEAAQVFEALVQQQGWLKDGAVYVKNMALMFTGIKP